jgi:23S rRNA (cytosine1962-C5)-methyltransferase
MPEALDAAAARRAGLVSQETDALRLVDGAGDGIPGVIVETFAGRLLLSTTGSRVPIGVRAWLEDQDRSAYWKRLDQHQKESPVHLCGSVQDEPFIIRENGRSFEISFRSGYSQGIFLDQRDNRAGGCAPA